MSFRHLMTIAAAGLAAAVPLSSTSAQATAAVRTKPLKPATQAQQARAPGVEADRKFIREIASDNMLEVRLAELAERKATSPAVKQFAQRVVTDHTKMQDEVRSLATSSKLTFDPGLGQLHQQKLHRMEKVTAKNFDREYMTLMVQNHNDDVNYFDGEGHTAQSAVVRNLVAVQLPTLREHLKVAKQVSAEVGVDTVAVLKHHKLAST